MADYELENTEVNELEDSFEEEIAPEEAAFVGEELYIDEDERKKAEKASLPIVAIVAITVAVLFAATCFFIIKFSKDKQNTDEPTGTTASQDYNAEVYDGQLYINGVAIDNKDVGISDDEVEEYASRLNSGNATVNPSVANKYNITTNKAPVANTPAVNTGNSANKTTTQPITKAVAVKNIYFAGGSREMYVGESVKLIWVFVPSNTTQKGITFTSSNPDVASVDHVGKVTAKSIGTATITVTSKFNKNLNDIYKIKVVEEKTTAEPATFPTWPTTTKPQTTVPTTKEPTTAEPTTEAPTTAYVPKEVSKIKLVGGKSREVNIGCYSSIICKTEPSGTTMKDLKFTSSDIGVCIVDANGRAFGVSPGTAVITITPKTGAATPETVYITVK